MRAAVPMRTAAAKTAPPAMTTNPLMRTAVKMGKVKNFIKKEE
jgi:hypothetical protein